jgi:two-component system, chemotaxis family, response regulator Rcp1
LAIPTPKSFRSLDVLLVEDNGGDATLTFEAFKDFKTPVDLIRVKDGEDAIAYLKKKSKYADVRTPDLILLDLNIPKKSGLEVLEEVKSDPQLREIPVVVLTSSNSDSDIRKAYAAKANFYIVKPSDLNGFNEAMRYVEEVWLPTLKYQDSSEKK